MAHTPRAFPASRALPGRGADDTGLRAARRRGKVGENMSAEFFDKLARTTPDGAAATILKGVAADKRRVLIGSDAHVIDALQRMNGAKTLGDICPFQPIVCNSPSL